jgi:uncharacterized MAPEG superfamily protein
MSFARHSVRLPACCCPACLWAIAAKTMERYGMRDNLHPRESLARLSCQASRTNWEQLNSFEAFPTFAAEVLVAQYAHHRRKKTPPRRGMFWQGD